MRRWKWGAHVSYLLEPGQAGRRVSNWIPMKYLLLKYVLQWHPGWAKTATESVLAIGNAFCYSKKYILQCPNTFMQLSTMHCIVLDCISLRCTFGLHWMAFRSVQTFEPCALFPRWLWRLNRNRDEIIHHHSLTRNKRTHANAKSTNVKLTLKQVDSFSLKPC